MAVDLADLIESLEREISPPGTNLYPDALEDEFLGHLQDAFWEAKLQGSFAQYTLNDTIIQPLGNADELGREWQQLIVLYAGYRIVLSSLRNAQASFRAKAGPVEFEQTTAATVLRDVLKALQDKIKFILDYLSTVSGSGTSTTVFDAIINRTDNTGWGESWWLR